MTGNGIPFDNIINHSPMNLQSIGMLQQLTTNPAGVSKADIVGLVGGSLVGWYISNKFPKVIVKYIGVVVGAELGILIARMVRR